MQDAAKPVSELEFPSVTICSSGLNMEAVRRALFNDFANWKIDKTNKDKVSDQEDEDSLKIYMEEKYAMTPGEGSILDTIKGMNSPPVGDEDRKENTAAVVSTLASCSKKSQPTRKKRSDEGRFNDVRLQSFVLGHICL